MRRRPRRPAPTIPRGELEKGIYACFRVVQARLDEATVLLRAGGYATQAAIIFSFAVEEFGKAVLLREAYESAEDPAVIAGFYDHSQKIDAAARWIPEENLLLHGGVFDRRVFQATAFDVDSPADLDARLSALYVDWESGRWHTGLQVDFDLLAKNIEAVEQILLETKIRWAEKEGPGRRTPST